VTFTVDGQAETPVPLVLVGVLYEARFTTSTLAVGSHSVGARYSNDAHVAGSSGGLPMQTVSGSAQPGNPQATITTMTSSPSPADAGATVTFTAMVSPAEGTGTPTGTVTLTIDGTRGPSVPLQVVGGSDQATFSTSTLAPGTHTIVMTYSGDATFAGSATQEASEIIMPRTPSPTPSPNGAPSSRPGAPPVVVSLKRYGVYTQPTRLAFTFDTAMDPARAQDVHNYLILTPSRKSIRIRRAVYDPASRTVTLSLRRRVSLHHTYYVAINAIGAGGVADTRAVLLDGFGAGKAGNDYVSPLNRKSLVLTPSEIRRGLPRWLFHWPVAAGRS
jgi:hypothetical protein